MKNAELYKGFSEKQAEHEGWLVERYGGPMRKAVSHAPKLSYEQSNAMAELCDIEQSLASAMEKGIVPEARELDMLVERHHRWVRLYDGCLCRPRRHLRPSRLRPALRGACAGPCQLAAHGDEGLGTTQGRLKS
jgi:hypothetical protein